jgi:hypothetical protein
VQAHPPRAWRGLRHQTLGVKRQADQSILNRPEAGGVDGFDWEAVGPVVC